jgi:hypothetical protein
MTETIERGRAYPLADFMRITGLKDEAVRNAFRDGLRSKLVGRAKFILGDDWCDFVTAPAPTGKRAKRRGVRVPA